jgi:hypothetical protein
VPSQTDSLPITSWDETTGNPPLLCGFFVVCASFIAVGASVGYHGSSWHFSMASINYRMLIVTIAMMPGPVLLWMQQKFHFIAGEAHYGITSACFILGVLIGSAFESLRQQRPGPPRLWLTTMHISVALIGGLWLAIASEKVRFLWFRIPIKHHAVWSVSLIGVLVGWVISISLAHHLKYSRPTSIALAVIALGHLVVLVVLPRGEIFKLLHEIGLHLLGTPTVVIAVLTGINSGVTMNPTATADSP